ncbi:hypothetical protein ACWGB8_27870 [Kitasatospora sp. NPDC054939]
MTAAVPFSRPHRSPERHQGDAEPAPRELMTLPGAHRDVRRWRLVEIRLGGHWRPAVLTVWRRPPGGTGWVVHVAWGEDAPGRENWGWFLFDDQRIRPLPEPAGTGPAGVGPAGAGGQPDAVLVPRELAGPPATAPAERCWRLAWLRTGGAWHSALVTARRRPAPGMPWIAHARWGEDRSAAWVIADPAALRPVGSGGSDGPGGPPGPAEGGAPAGGPVEPGR